MKLHELLNEKRIPEGSTIEDLTNKIQSVLYSKVDRVIGDVLYGNNIHDKVGKALKNKSTINFSKINSGIFSFKVSVIISENNTDYKFESIFTGECKYNFKEPKKWGWEITKLTSSDFKGLKIRDGEGAFSSIYVDVPINLLKGNKLSE